METVALGGYAEKFGDLSWVGFSVFGWTMMYNYMLKTVIVRCTSCVEVVIINKICYRGKF